MAPWVPPWSPDAFQMSPRCSQMPPRCHPDVSQMHIVWFQTSTLSGSKTAHCLVPRQHIVWFQDSTLSGSKTARCLEPRNPKLALFIKSGMNRSAMAPHGLILSQDGVTPSKMIFIWVWGIFYGILGTFLIKIGPWGLRNIGGRRHGRCPIKF